MSLDNNSANNFKDFLDAIKPFLNYQLYDMSGMGVEAFQFSTDEKPVGMWTDRKILYAKTVDCGAMPNNTVKDVPHGISNVDKIWVFSGYAHNPTNGYFNPLQLPNDTISGQWYACATASNIKIAAFTDRSSYSDVSVTLFYTKTTDSPLSSDEKFAGVTSSGEIIYERTVSFTNKGSNSQMLEFDSGISIVDYHGFMENNNDKLPIVGYYWNSSEYCSSYVTNSGEKIRLSTSFSGKNVTVTIRYTKSS